MSKYTYDPSLIGKHCRFNQRLHDKYDIPARAVIRGALGAFVSDNPDIYAQDLIINDPGFKYQYIEIQVCTMWTCDKYPYEFVNVYERKHKYPENTLFITLNKKMDAGYIFDAKSFKNQKPQRIKKYGREFVYNIPWNLVMNFNIQDLTPDLIKMY
jgi:hypothetical protein